MSLPCSISAWGCPYHACMTDECQKRFVISSGVDWGKGNCKPKPIIKMKKRMFEVLDQMNLKDTAAGTRTVATSVTVVEAKKCKQGGLITIGVDEESLMDVFSGKARVILCVVDWDAYKKEEKI